MHTIFAVNVKSEPPPERPKWSLIAVSQAARKWRGKFLLEANKTYKVGRSRQNDIIIASPFCKKQIHCTLQVSDVEIIMKDQVCCLKS